MTAPTEPRARPANQIAPSGPAVTPTGPSPGTGNSLIWPSVVMRPTWFAFSSLNQRAPSGPTAMRCGRPSGVGVGYSLIVPSVAQSIDSSNGFLSFNRDRISIEGVQGCSRGGYVPHDVAALTQAVNGDEVEYEVALPGEFITVGPTLTLSQAIARAGGLKIMSSDENKCFIIISRSSPGSAGAQRLW